MTVQLAFRNIKKSMSDYAVYFVTLIIGISLFYVFNSIYDQSVVQHIFKSSYDIIDSMKQMLTIASVIVSIVLAFLVMYASNFLMKRRKKEFGVYMLLGMKKKTIAGILVVETISIGVISLLVGLGVGIVLSQGMSILVAKMFAVDMSAFTFEVSGEAIGKTILYFAIIYVFVVILDIIVVQKSRLITLFQAGRRAEKNTNKNPIVCGILFVVAAVVLGHAYYMVTANKMEMVEPSMIVIQIVKGIVSTYVLFWSLSGLLVFLAKARKKSYLRGLRIFTVREISNRINTNVFAAGTICLFLFITICVFSTAFSVNYSVRNNLEKLAPVDINLIKAIPSHKALEKGKGFIPTSVSEDMEKQGLDRSMFQEETEVLMHLYMVEGKEPSDSLSLLEPGMTMALKESDYDKIAKVYNLEPIDLKDDEYVMVCNYEYSKKIFDEQLANGKTITLAGRELRSQKDQCVDGFVEISDMYSNFGFLVLSDEVVEQEKNLYPTTWFFIANYNAAHALGEEGIEKNVYDVTFQNGIGDNTAINTRRNLEHNSVGLTMMLVFLGLYLGITFILASTALLSLKELSQAADNREKYQMLRKIGVDEGMMRRSLLCQSLMFFGSPLALSIVHSVFGIQVCMFIMESFGKTGMLPGIIFTASVLLVIYIIYFLITYRCSCRIIDEK